MRSICRHHRLGQSLNGKRKLYKLLSEFSIVRGGCEKDVRVMSGVRK